MLSDGQHSSTAFSPNNIQLGSPLYLMSFGSSWWDVGVVGELLAALPYILL